MCWLSGSEVLPALKATLYVVFAAIRSNVAELASTMLTAEGKAKVDQILANLCNPGQENAEPLLSDHDVHPLWLLMDEAALSKAPLVLAGLQELSRLPSILSDGRFKTLVMATSPGTSHCLYAVGHDMCFVATKYHDSVSRCTSVE